MVFWDPTLFLFSPLRVPNKCLMEIWLRCGLHRSPKDCGDHANFRGNCAGSKLCISARENSQRVATWLQEHIYLFCVPSVLRMQALHVAPRPGNTNNEIVFSLKLVGFNKTTVQWCIKTRLKCCQVTSCSISMVLAVFLCFFSSACVMSFHVCFLKIWAKFPWHHSFAHVARGYSEMHLFKCWW